MADKSVAVARSRLISCSPFFSTCRLKRQQHRISTARLSPTFLFLSAEKSARDGPLSIVRQRLIYYSFKHFPECCAVTTLVFMHFLCSDSGRQDGESGGGSVWRPSLLPWLNVSPAQGTLFGSSVSSFRCRFNDTKCPAA